MDKRQILKQKTVIFSDERLISGIFGLVWLVWGWVLCQPGFGEDTDAWLMAQTAQKLSLGLGYDPARSLGNPVYEFLLVLLQPNLQWIWSNLFNLLVSLLFLFRLGKAFPQINTTRLLFFRLTLAALPVFSEAASSSMESMLSWYFLLETVIALRRGSQFSFLVFSTLASFIRPEFFPLICVSFAFLPSSTEGGPNRKIPFRGLFLPAILWLGYLLWAGGKNPIPFENLSDGIRFYEGRGWFLLKQAGFIGPVYLFLMSGVIPRSGQDPAHRIPGLTFLFFFLLFPFEWAYAFPAMLFGTARWIAVLPKNLRYALPPSILFLSLLSLSHGKGISLSMPSQYQRRQRMVRLFQLADNSKIQSLTLLLNGATFLPTDVQKWEPSMQNRLFHKRGTGLYVAEKLRLPELDSLWKEGFKIYGISHERGGIPDTTQVVHWIRWDEMERVLGELTEENH